MLPSGTRFHTSLRGSGLSPGAGQRSLYLVPTCPVLPPHSPSRVSQASPSNTLFAFKSLPHGLLLGPRTKTLGPDSFPRDGALELDCLPAMGQQGATATVWGLPAVPGLSSYAGRTKRGEARGRGTLAWAISLASEMGAAAILKILESGFCFFK